MPDSTAVLCKKCRLPLRILTEMKRRAAAIILCLFFLCAELLLAQARESPGLNVGAKDLLASPPVEDWPSYNGDYTGRRFSGLAEINRSNAARLRAAWVFHPGN